MRVRSTLLSAGTGLGLVFVAGLACLLAAAPVQAGRTPPDRGVAPELRTGEAVYLAACANCHAADGRGASQSLVGFALKIRDFTDCQSTVREADTDWLAVVTQGGPARGFSELMPAFGSVLTPEQVVLAVGHLRTFCSDHSWPRGDLNLPRPLFTEKAFPEDEAALTTAVDTKGPGMISSFFVYEQRLGPRNQFEIKVPFGWRKAAGAEEADWSSSLGDVALGFKRAFLHSFERGTIFSGGGEVIVPTGDEAGGFGKGTFVFEPFLALGQILPGDFFLEAQAGMELPFRTARAESEAYLNLALGWGTDLGQWGRSLAPMVELLAVRELAAGAPIVLDIVPQVQVSLNKRKNILANLGLGLPLTNTSGRSPRVVFYLLWDWFDGTLFEGW